MRWLLVSALTQAQAVFACDLALVLAVDVSGSVDSREYDLQISGLAEALRDGSVSEALVVARAQVMMLQWTGASRQAVSVPWRHITSFEAADALAAEIAVAPRVWRNFSTAIGEALIAAEGAFTEVPECARRIIDVSGDGPNNEGIFPTERHAALAAQRITVNGLAIEASEEGLTEWFAENLITGPGAFAMRAADFEEYPARIRLKLLREITDQVSLQQDDQLDASDVITR